MSKSNPGLGWMLGVGLAIAWVISCSSDPGGTDDWTPDYGGGSGGVKKDAAKDGAGGNDGSVKDGSAGKGGKNTGGTSAGGQGGDNTGGSGKGGSGGTNKGGAGGSSGKGGSSTGGSSGKGGAGGSSGKGGAGGSGGTNKGGSSGAGGSGGTPNDLCLSARTDVTAFPALSRSAVVANGKKYVDYVWTPQAGNLAPNGVNHCGYTISTSSLFQAGSPVTGFPYKKAGYDDLYVFEQCLGESFGNHLYLGGTISQVMLGRSCGVLGLDCAGFIGKAYGLGPNEYSSPSMISSNCPALGTGKDYSQAKPGDVLKRYGGSLITHFILVASNNPGSSQVVVYEAGSAFESSDRVAQHTIDYSDLNSASFTLCVPDGLTDP